MRWSSFSVDRYSNYITACLADGSGSVVLSSFISTKECSFSQIRSDGEQVVFVSFDAANSPQIYLLKLATTQVLQLTVDGGDTPAYSPDGKKIVYTRTAKGDGALWVMDADGANKRRLTSP
jgi:TolB protein